MTIVNSYRGFLYTREYFKFCVWIILIFKIILWDLLLSPLCKLKPEGTEVTQLLGGGTKIQISAFDSKACIPNQDILLSLKLKYSLGKWITYFSSVI